MVACHCDLNGDNQHRDAHEKSVEHLSMTREPLPFGERTHQWPPPQHRRRHEHQVLDDVNFVVRHREIVEIGNMPTGEYEIEDRKAPHRPGNPASNRRDDVVAQQWPRHTARNYRDEQGGNRQRQQVMLHDLRAAEKVDAQIVKRTVELRDDEA